MLMQFELFSTCTVNKGLQPLVTESVLARLQTVSIDAASQKSININDFRRGARLCAPTLLFWSQHA